MYKIYKNNRVAAHYTFSTYEQARQAARKLIRRFAQRSPYDTSNPMFCNYGFSVKKV